MATILNTARKPRRRWPWVLAGAALAFVVLSALLVFGFGPLVSRLASQSSGIRWQAIQDLGSTGDPSVAEHVVPMLKDSDVFVRMASARSAVGLDTTASSMPRMQIEATFLGQDEGIAPASMRYSARRANSPKIRNTAIRAGIPRNDPPDLSRRKKLAIMAPITNARSKNFRYPVR